MATRRARRNPPLPSAPPKRRFSGAPVTTQQERSALARVRRIAGSVDERDRPFNPERPGSWRGSSRDLVVNGRREGMLSDGTRVVVYHKPGTLDEYTIVPHGADWDQSARGGMRQMLGCSATGRGFSQWTEGQEGRHLGRKVTWSEVPAELRAHIESRVAGEQTPNPQDSSSYGAGARLRPGYAFEGPDVPNRELIEIPNDDWETVMISEDDCKDTRFVQYLTIDGSRCSVFERKSPPYGYLAQMSHMARNGEVDPRDIPAHLRGAELRDEPEHNGQDVGYSQGMRGKSAEWFQVEYATGSDYSGGSVNESNYQVLGEMLDEHHPEDAEPVVWARTSGGHGTYGIVVRYGDLEDEVREAIDALEDYPLMDDEHHTNLEMEQQQAAWDDWGVGELSKALAKETGVDRDELRDNLTDGDWYQIFDLVMQRGDITWEDQQGAGQYIDMDLVAEQVVKNLEKMPSYATPEQDKAYELLGNLVGAPEDD
jgi:hypothetical protein